MAGSHHAPPESGPRVAVVGSGGIGAFFGAQLSARGTDVVYCGRRPFRRLRIESPIGAFDGPVRCLTDPASVGPGQGVADWLLLAVKTHQTAAAAGWLAGLCGRSTRVVSLQNGVEDHQRLTPLVGGAQILATTVYCGAELREPGLVHHRGPARMVLDDVPVSEELRALFSGTAATIELTPDFRTEKWRKLMVNVAANGITALTRRPIGVLQEPHVADLARAVMAELLPVSRAEGAALTDHDADAVLAGLQAPEAAAATTSMYQDQLAGRLTEHDALYGAVVRAGQRHGIDTPLHRTLGALLAGTR